MKQIPLNPTKIIFPIFWFPILIPLILTIFGVFGDAATLSDDGKLILYFKGLRGVALSVFKNSHLSFVSTDLWAITTLLMYCVHQRLHGLRIWSLGFGMIIGMFLHMLFYFLISIMAPYSWSPFPSAVLFILGAVGVYWIRLTVYERMEIQEIGVLMDSLR